MQETINIDGVPETMLWTLHSRASEAARADGVLKDRKALEIYRAINYDYERSFGPAEPSMALRAMRFDLSLKAFLRRHPVCSIVNLGEGLETQRFRIDAPEAHWYTVDLPEAISVRERFIAADARHTHLALSATDPRWLDRIPQDRPVFISAQGLFMYLPRREVKALLRNVAVRFERCHVIFDAIPRWVSRASVISRGLPRTPFYRTPPMPWGLNRYALKPTLRRWLRRDAGITLSDYPPYPRGPARLLTAVAPRLPGVRHWAPTIVDVALH